MADPRNRSVQEWLAYYQEVYPNLNLEQATLMARVSAGDISPDERTGPDARQPKLPQWMKNIGTHLGRPRAPIGAMYDDREDYLKDLQNWKDKYAIGGTAYDAPPTAPDAAAAAAAQGAVQQVDGVVPFGPEQFDQAGQVPQLYEEIDQNKMNLFLAEHPIAGALTLEAVMMLMSSPTDTSGNYIDWGDGSGYSIDQIAAWMNNTKEGKDWQAALTTSPDLAYQAAGFYLIENIDGSSEWAKMPKGTKPVIDNRTGEYLRNKDGSYKAVPMTGTELEAAIGRQKNAVTGAAFLAGIEPKKIQTKPVESYDVTKANDRVALAAAVQAGTISAEKAFGPGSQFERWAIGSANQETEQRAQQLASQGMGIDPNDPMLSMLANSIERAKAMGINTKQWEQELTQMMYTSPLRQYESYGVSGYKPETTEDGYVLNPADAGRSVSGTKRTIKYLQRGIDNEEAYRISQEIAQAEQKYRHASIGQLMQVYTGAAADFMKTYTEADYQPPTDDPYSGGRLTADNLTGPDEDRDPFFEYWDGPSQSDIYEGFNEFLRNNPQYQSALKEKDLEGFKKYDTAYQGFVDQRFNVGGIASWQGYVSQNPLLRARIDSADEEERKYKSDQRRYASATKTPRTRWLNY